MYSSNSAPRDDVSTSMTKTNQFTFLREHAKALSLALQYYIRELSPTPRNPKRQVRMNYE